MNITPLYLRKMQNIRNRKINSTDPYMGKAPENWQLPPSARLFEGVWAKWKPARPRHHWLGDASDQWCRCDLPPEETISRNPNHCHDWMGERTQWVGKRGKGWPDPHEAVWTWGSWSVRIEASVSKTVIHPNPCCRPWPSSCPLRGASVGFYEFVTWTWL